MHLKSKISSWFLQVNCWCFMNKRFKNNLFVSLSFLLCFLIDSFPFSLQLNEIKPSLVLLSLIYWNLALPERIGIGFSLSLGILYDFLQGTLFGIYPLIFIVTSYLCQRFFYQIRPMRFFQQSLIIFLLILLIKFFLSIDFDNSIPSHLSLLDKRYIFSASMNAAISAIFWPIIFSVLRRYRRKWIAN